MIWAIGVPAYLIMMFLAYHIERRVVGGAESAEDLMLRAVFWPLRLALLALLVALAVPVGIGYGIFEAFKASNGFVDRLLAGGTGDKERKDPPRLPPGNV